MVVIDNSKLIHLYIQLSVQGRSVDSFPKQRLGIEPMVWVPNGLNKLPKVHFKFCFIFIGKLKMAFLTGQSWRLLKSWYSAGGPEQGFRCCFTEGLKVTRPSFFGGVPSYFEALWYPHLYFYRKSNT